LKVNETSERQGREKNDALNLTIMNKKILEILNNKKGEKEQIQIH